MSQRQERIGRIVAVEREYLAASATADLLQERRGADPAFLASHVILEYVPIGVCDRGAARDFEASILRRVADVDSGRASRDQTPGVPVAR